MTSRFIQRKKQSQRPFQLWQYFPVTYFPDFTAQKHCRGHIFFLCLEQKLHLLAKKNPQTYSLIHINYIYIQEQNLDQWEWCIFVHKCSCAANSKDKMRGLAVAPLKETALRQFGLISLNRAESSLWYTNNKT